MMEKIKEGKLTCISIFQAFPSILSVNILLARPGQKSARAKSPGQNLCQKQRNECVLPLVVGIARSQQSEELVATMQSTTVVL